MGIDNGIDVFSRTGQSRTLDDILPVTMTICQSVFSKDEKTSGIIHAHWHICCSNSYSGLKCAGTVTVSFGRHEAYHHGDGTA